MNKPIEVARQEFIDGMINFINEAGLPSFMIAEVMEKILPAVKANVDKEYNNSLIRYNQALAEEAKKAEESKGGDAEIKSENMKQTKRKKEVV